MDSEVLINLDNTYREVKEIEESLNIIEQQLRELEEFKIGLKNIEENKNNEILASLGKGVFIKSEIKDKKLFVDVGSGIIIRKTPKATIETVEDQINKLSEIRSELAMRMNSAKMEFNELIKKGQDSQTKR